MFNIKSRLKNLFKNIFNYTNDDSYFEIERENSKQSNIYFEWVDRFLESPSFEKLTEEQQELAAFILKCVDEYLELVNARDPVDWDGDILSELCLEVFPCKITAELEFFKCIGPVLISFFNFLSENKLLKQAWRLSTCIKTIQASIPKRAADPKNWGLAKTFAMRALQEGVDLDDPVQNAKFIKRMNQELKKSNHITEIVFVD